MGKEASAAVFLHLSVRQMLPSLTPVVRELLYLPGVPAGPIGEASCAGYHLF